MELILASAGGFVLGITLAYFFSSNRKNKMVKTQQHTHVIEFKHPLTINLNVTVTQKQDERVAELEKQMSEWLGALDKKIKKLEHVSGQVDSTK